MNKGAFFEKETSERKINKDISMRDACFKRIYELAKNDNNIVVLSADMGAPALDDFRRDFGDKFFNVGIAEHNMIAIGAGLAKEGKKVFTYAIAPFITSRCYEFTKLNAGLMKIPITLIGVGAGFGYEDSGPTHHTTEDISIMRVIPHLEIISPSDSVMAEKSLDYAYNSENPVYLRLERKLMPVIHNGHLDISEGFEELKIGNEIGIVSTGYMVHKALEISKIFRNEIGVIDLYRLKPISHKFISAISPYKRIVSLEEHLLDGGLGSIVSETITDNDLNVKLKRVGLKDYVYDYGRESLHKTCGIDIESLVKVMERYL